MGEVRLTTREAGYVLERSNLAINKAIDSGLIRGGLGASRVLGRSELRFLKLADMLDKDLTRVGRKKIYDALNRLPDGEHLLLLGPLTIELAPIDRMIEARVARLAALAGLVEVRPDGEPVLRGTAVPVYEIAAIADQETAQDILADYPSLTVGLIEAAVDYAKAYPKRGRPYPARNFKRAAAALGLKDLDVERTREGPRLMPP